MIYTRCLAVAEVDVERGNAGIGRCTVLANLEVGTAGTDAGTRGGLHVRLISSDALRHVVLDVIVEERVVFVVEACRSEDIKEERGHLTVVGDDERTALVVVLEVVVERCGDYK